jgi:hypothetical protein
MCGLGVGIGEAAHIVEVKNGGSDETENGILLCPTHHSAWDAGHILVDADSTVTVNRTRLEELGFANADISKLEDMTSGSLVPPVGGTPPSRSHLESRRNAAP